MEKTPQRYTLTAALLYANGPVHIGHLGGCYLPADVYARYLRATGADVLFISGSDEHGVAITMKARQEGLTPRQVIDKYHPMIEQAFRDFDISFDIYSRTSLPVHHQTSQEFFLKFYNENKFEETTTEQYYDEEAKQFLADRYIRGTCPVCANPDAYGDQCERCGSSLSPTDLKNPRSALSGKPPVLRPTTHWFLPLDKYQGWINQYVENHSADWKANVLGQCRSWLAAGLKPRAMTRDLDWGVAVPSQIPGHEGKVLYVWFDAPIGYISAAKDWAQNTRKQPDAWKPYWLKEAAAGGTRLVHFIGKDNIVFHCIIFPAMLQQHGAFVLADNVPANEFLNLEGDKISTSRNWAVWAHQYVADFKHIPRSTDMLRYVLASIMPETKDAEFTWKDFQQRVNSELVGIYSNFVHRVLSLIQKYYGGAVPQPQTREAADEELLLQVSTLKHAAAVAIENFKFKEALAEVMNMARAGNKYLADTEPWHLHKTNPARVQTILYNALQVVNTLAVASEPFLPQTSTTLLRLAGMGKQPWGEVKTVAPGTQLPTPEMLFKNVEDAEIEKQVAALAATRTATPAQPQAAPKPVAAVKGAITYEQFAALDLRLGTITAAERVPKADKLLKLQVDIGSETRTIVSGIAEHYAPENIIGQRVLVLANLAPKKLRGIDSQGMILMAENAAGKLAFVSPSAAGFADGDVVK
jgi:methionyl-tRNA synthetase